MSDPDLRPNAEEIPHTYSAFTRYDVHGKVAKQLYIEGDLLKRIQVLERVVCQTILYGHNRKIEVYYYATKLFRKPVAASPRLIRSRDAKIPAPEARSWVWYFLHRHPDYNEKVADIANLYGWSRGTVKTALRLIERQLETEANPKITCPDPLKKKLQAVADGLTAQGFQEFTVEEKTR